MKFANTFWILIAVLLIVTMIPDASATEWDNVKSYNPETKTVTITNWLGLGENLIEAKLLTNHNELVSAGKDVKVAEIEIYFSVKQEFNVNKIDFYDLNMDSSKINNIAFKFKEKSIKNELIENYICLGTGKDEVCKDASYYGDVAYWNDIDLNKEFNEKEKITIGIFTDVKAGETVEWIPTFLGVKIEEWATWTGTVTHGLTDDSTGGVSGVSTGVKINTTQAFYVNGLIKFATEGGTTGYILNNSGTKLVNCTFSGTYCAFNTPYLLTVDTNYTFAVDNLTENFQPNRFKNTTFPIYNTTFLNWIDCYRDDGPCSPSRLYSIQSVNITVILPVPSISINLPANNSNYSSSPSAITFNCTSDDDVGVLNVSLWINDNLNYTQTNSTPGENISMQKIINFGNGNYNWTCKAWDGANEGTNGTRRFIVDAIPPTLSILSPSGNYYLPPENFTLNFSASDAGIGVDSCFYSMNAGANVSVNCTAETNITINHIGNNNFTLYANDSLGNLNYTSTTFAAYPTFQQCNTTIAQKSINFTTYNETNLAMINDTILSGSFVYWTDSNIYNTTYAFTTAASATGEFDFCIYPNWSSITADASIDYSKTDYDTRNYLLSDAALNNITQHIKLYLLESASSTDLVAKILDSNLIAQKNVDVQLLRYYPATDAWVQIASDRSDELGQTIFHVIEKTVNYKFILSRSGNILYTTDSVKIVCYATPCEIEITIPSTTGDLFQYYTNASGVSYNLSWNNNTQIASLLFSSIDGTPKTMKILINHINVSNEAIVCDNSTTAASGLLTCNLSTYTNNFFAQAYINTTSGWNILDRISISTANFFRTTGTEGLFYSALFIMTLVFIGIWNPVVSIIMACIGFVLLGILGIISLGWMALISIVILGVMIIIQLKT